jgi:DNA-binding transcriptional LysR family regulator
VGSDYFSKRGNNGLPLACYPEGCVFRARAANRLDKAGIPWRVGYSSASSSGIHAAVGAGLAITVMAEGTIPSDLYIMDEELQLPELGGGEIRLMQRTGTLSDAAELLKTALKHMY